MRHHYRQCVQLFYWRLSLDSLWLPSANRQLAVRATNNDMSIIAQMSLLLCIAASWLSAGKTMQIKSSNANYRQLRCLGQPHYKHTWQSFVCSGQCHGHGREKVPLEMLSFESGQQLPIGKVSRVTQASDLTVSAGPIGFSTGRKGEEVRNRGWWLKLPLHNEQRRAGEQPRQVLQESAKARFALTVHWQHTIMACARW